MVGAEAQPSGGAACTKRRAARPRPPACSPRPAGPTSPATTWVQACSGTPRGAAQAPRVRLRAAASSTASWTSSSGTVAGFAGEKAPRAPADEGRRDAWTTARVSGGHRGCGERAARPASSSPPSHHSPAPAAAPMAPPLGEQMGLLAASSCGAAGEEGGSRRGHGAPAAQHATTNKRCAVRFGSNRVSHRCTYHVAWLAVVDRHPRAHKAAWRRRCRGGVEQHRRRLGAAVGAVCIPGDGCAGGQALARLQALLQCAEGAAVGQRGAAADRQVAVPHASASYGSKAVGQRAAVGC